MLRVVNVGGQESPEVRLALINAKNVQQCFIAYGTSVNKHRLHANLLNNVMAAAAAAASVLVSHCLKTSALNRKAKIDHSWLDESPSIWIRSNNNNGNNNNNNNANSNSNKVLSRAQLQHRWSGCCAYKNEINNNNNSNNNSQLQYIVKYRRKDDWHMAKSNQDNNDYFAIALYWYIDQLALL